MKESILLLGERFEVEEKAKELVNGFEEKEAGSKRPVRLLAVVQVSYDGPNLAMLVATQEGRINQHAQITVYSE